MDNKKKINNSTSKELFRGLWGFKMFKKAIISVTGLVIFSAIIIAAFAMTNNNDTNNQNIQGMVTSDTALNTILLNLVGYKSTNYHTVS